MGEGMMVNRRGGEEEISELGAGRETSLGTRTRYRPGYRAVRELDQQRVEAMPIKPPSGMGACFTMLRQGDVTG